MSDVTAIAEKMYAWRESCAEEARMDKDVLFRVWSDQGGSETITIGEIMTLVEEAVGYPINKQAWWNG